VELGLVAAGAEIDIHAADLGGRRKVAPAAIIGTVSRDIGRDVAVLVAGLRASGNSPERSAEQFGLGAVIAEAVLHLDR
jgi:hypothetical protein